MQDILLEKRRIGESHPCFIIGEIGLNHNGSVELAQRLIDACQEAGVDCVKFQKRNVAGLAIKDVLDAPDPRFPEFGRTYRDIRNHLEFDARQYRQIINHARSRGMIFLCTAFDIPSVDFLETLDVCGYKTASHSVTNLPLLKKLAKIAKPVILSTGMCVLKELDRAVDILKSWGAPLVLLHCVSSYPQAPEESNLKIIDTLRERYGVTVGYSGHEIGAWPTLLAVARGAKVVERHVTLDKTMVGFDHKLSLEPAELKGMALQIRQVEQILGSGEKWVSEREQVTRNKYHVSIVSARIIKGGSRIEESMLDFKNPGTGLPVSSINDVLGKRAKWDIPEDTLLTLDMLEG
ncbi:MAG: hypothetical protein A3D87_03515 [Omnitrophica WOR_2 bacterium RIFCSPHIGHO2_02_FULL_50_17]|nr:MAG: hypothetical protein A3D87_03515 [Omnitrophica WOR_2 bacterium RIFCSPHIGHO2_02_FULL_50_17]